MNKLTKVEKNVKKDTDETVVEFTEKSSSP